MPQRLMGTAVYGAFPIAGGDLYLPAPSDCLSPGESRLVLAVKPVDPGDGCGGDFPSGSLRPVMLTEDQSKADFKPAAVPAWWPMEKYERMASRQAAIEFDPGFSQCRDYKRTRDHVCLDADTGAAAEGPLRHGRA